MINFRTYLITFVYTKVRTIVRIFRTFSIHPIKSVIIKADRGIEFLGLRVFLYHKLLKKKNLAKFQCKFNLYSERFSEQKITYDQIYDFMEGWLAYARNANTYHLRKRFLADYETKYLSEISTKEINRARPKNRSRP